MIESPETSPSVEPEEFQRTEIHSLSAAAAGLLSLVPFGMFLVAPQVALFIAPLGLIPVLAYQARHPRWYLAWAWVAVVLAVATVSGLAAYSASVLAIYLLVVVFPCLSIHWWRLLGWPEGRWALMAASVCVVSSLFVFSAVAAPESPVDGLTVWFSESIGEAEETLISIGVPKGEASQAADAVVSVGPWVVPSIPVTYFVAILFWIRPRLVVLGIPVPAGPFEEYRSEEWLPAGFALFGIGTVFLQGTPRWVALNLLLTVLILYFVHGLAIIRAHLARFIGRGWFVRWGVVLICLQMPLPPLVAFLGVADSFFPMRPKANDDGGNS